MRRCERCLLELDEEFDIDVIHGHGGYVGPVAKAPLDKCKILTLHNTYEYDNFVIDDLKRQGFYARAFLRSLFHPQFLLNRYRRWYYNHVDRIISVTHYNAEITNKMFGVSLDKFSVVYNGFDLPEYSEKMVERGENRFDLLFVGRLAPLKGVPVLLRALEKIKVRYSQVRLALVGDGEYSGYVTNLIGDLGLGENVVLTGFLPREDLYDIIASSRIVVMPSIQEGIPVSLFEAAAFGKSIVVSRLSGISEVLRDGIDCLMFSPGDVDECADRISLLLSNSDLCDKLGVNAKTNVSSKYSWDDIAKSTVKVYEECLNMGND